MRLPVTPRTTLLRELRDEVRRSYRAGRVIIAVDGIDGAGKTVFADGLADVFAEDGTSVFRASVDGFHRPRAERYARGRDSPEGFYLDSYDEATLRRVLIDPFREGATMPSTGFQLAAWDVDRDVPAEARWVTGPEDAVLIIDGIFRKKDGKLTIPADVLNRRLAELAASGERILKEPVEWSGQGLFYRVYYDAVKRHVFPHSPQVTSDSGDCFFQFFVCAAWGETIQDWIE